MEEQERGNPHAVQIGGGSIFLICAILAIALLWANCSHGYAEGYVGNICKNGASIWDMISIVCCSPLYLIFLIFFAKIPLRFW